jgi:hypothetical protein
MTLVCVGFSLSLADTSAKSRSVPLILSATEYVCIAEEWILASHRAAFVRWLTDVCGIGPEQSPYRNVAFGPGGRQIPTFR